MWTGKSDEEASGEPALTREAAGVQPLSPTCDTDIQYFCTLCSRHSYGTAAGGCRDCRDRHHQQTVVQPSSDSKSAGQPGGSTDGREVGLLHGENHPTDVHSEPATLLCGAFESSLDIGHVAPGTSPASGSPLDITKVIAGHNDHTLPTGDFLRKNAREGTENEGLAIQECGASNGTPVLESRQCLVVVLERGLIIRKTKTYAVYIIPEDQFEKKFANIHRNETVIYQSSFMDLNDMVTKQSQRRYCVPITKQLALNAQLVQGHNFKITSNNKFIIPLEKIIQEGDDRLGTASITIQVTCTGSVKEWCEDKVYLTLSTEAAQTLHITFSIWSYPSNNDWLMRESPVVAMPQEDVEALRKCHVPLLNKIHGVFDINQYLLMLKILEDDDIEEIKSHHNRKEQVAELLSRIKTRADILDIFVDVLRETRNEEAAQILIASRCALHQARIN